MIKTTKSILKKVTATLLAASIVTTAGIGTITVNAGQAIDYWSLYKTPGLNGKVGQTVTLPYYNPIKNHAMACQTLKYTKVKVAGENLIMHIGSQTQPFTFSSSGGTNFTISNRTGVYEIYNVTMTNIDTGNHATTTGYIYYTY